MTFSGKDLLAFIVCMVFASAFFLAVLAAAVRMTVRPMLADWAKLRSQGANAALEPRVAELEEELRQLKGSTQLQVPVDLRPGVHSSVRSGSTG